MGATTEASLIIPVVIMRMLITESTVLGVTWEPEGFELTQEGT